MEASREQAFATSMFVVVLKVVGLAVLVQSLRGLWWLVNMLYIQPPSDPLRHLPGPDGKKMENHFRYVMEYVVYFTFIASHHANTLFFSPDRTPETHEEWVKKYGKTFRFHGFGSVRTSPLNGLHGGELTANDSDFFDISQYDYRLMSLDLRAVSHVLNSPVYEKPWQTRKLLSRLLGRGALFCHLFIALIVRTVTYMPMRPFRCICYGG